MNYLATKNNNHAAKVAARNRTPYVPWNAEEVAESGFRSRIPDIGDHTPDGWELVSVLSVWDHTRLDALYNYLAAEVGESFGLAQTGFQKIGVFVPLAKAHEPRKAVR